MDAMKAYERARDGFDQVMAAVGADHWDQPSTCEGWNIRDVAGHVIWGQRQLRAWAIGEDYQSPTGFPGSTDPGVLTGSAPVETWRAAWTAADEALTDEALGRTVTLGALGDLPMTGVLELLTTDFLAHTWDIGHAAGQRVHLDAELLPGASAWSKKNVVRQPGFFGPEVTPAADADEQARLLAFLGREPGQDRAAS